MSEPQSLLLRDSHGRRIADPGMVPSFICVSGIDEALIHLRKAKPILSVAAESIDLSKHIEILDRLLADLAADQPYSVCPLYDPERYPERTFPDLHTRECRCCKGKKWLSRSEFGALKVKDWQKMAAEWGTMDPGIPGKVIPTPMPPAILKTRHIEILQAALAANAVQRERRKKAATLVAKIDPEASLGTYKSYLATLVRWGFLDIAGKERESGYWLTDKGKELVGRKA